MTVLRPSVFISHSSAEDPAVAYVRDRLFKELEERNELQILLDVRMLGGGDVWRPILHQWLAECDSAILLLSPKALDSDWVRTEATILTWRRSLGSKLTLIPVRLGCSRDAVVDKAAFKPLDLGNTQFESLSFDGDLADVEIHGEQVPEALKAAVDDLVSKVVSRLHTIEVDKDDLPMRRWVRDVSDVLDTHFPDLPRRQRNSPASTDNPRPTGARTEFIAAVSKKVGIEIELETIHKYLGPANRG